MMDNLYKSVVLGTYDVMIRIKVLRVYYRVIHAQKKDVFNGDNF
jgi:hypothetical protein